MKPLRLKIEGLHSFREAQDIDFTALCATGVFGIFGPTGSGKSTILDSITLALYGKVERANKNTQGIINHGADRVLVEFSFEIGTPGQKRTYKVERLYKRVGENNVNARNSRLSELTPAGEEVLADKDREVTLKVEEILGLTVEDFTRAVVLPQGKFSEFLALRDADRRKMLQRLFALEAYGDKLNDRLKKRLQQAAGDLNGVEREQQGLGDASTQAVAEAGKALDDARKKEKAAHAAQRKMLKEFEGEKQVWELQEEQQAILELSKQHNRLLPETEEQEKRLDIARRAEQVRPLLTALAESEQQWAAAQTKRGQAAQEFQAAAGQEVQVHKLCEECQEKRRQREPQLIQLKTRLEAVLIQEEELTRHKRELELLNSIIQAGQNSRQELARQQQQHEVMFKGTNSKLTELKKRAREISISPEYRGQLAVAVATLRDYRQITAQLGEARQEVNRKALEAQKARELLETCGQKVRTARQKAAEWEKLLEEKKTACPATEEDLLKRQQALERGRTQVSEVERCELEIAQAVAQVGATREIFNKCGLAVQQAEQQLQTARANLEKIQVLRERLDLRCRELERQNLAAVLVKGLQAGHPCPVCGSKDHPAPAEHTVDIDLEAIRTELTAAEKELSAAQTAFQEAIVQDSQARARFQAVQTQVEQSLKLQQDREQGRLQARGHLKDEVREKSLPELRKLLEQLEGRLAADLQARQNWLKAVDTLQQELHTAKDNLAGLENQHSAAENACSNAQRALEEAQGKLDRLIAGAGEQESSLEEKAAAVREKLDTVVKEKLDIVVKENPDTVAGETLAKELNAELRTEVNSYHYLEIEDEKVAGYDREAAENKREQDILEQKLAKITAALEELASKAKNLEVELARQEAKYQELTQQLQSKEVQVHTVTAGRPAKDLLAETEAGLNLLVREEAQARQGWEAARSRREKAEQGQAAAAREFEVAGQTVTKARDNLGQALQEAQFVTAGEARDALCTAGERSNLEKSIKAFRDKEKELNQELRRLESRLAGRTLTQEQWDAWQGKKTAAEEEYAEATRAASVAAAWLKELEGKHERWKKLQEDREKLAKLKDRLETLQRIFRGNAFVEFIAEEQVFNVALAASERLKRMTRHRYALEVDSEGGFIMRDDANGGVKRPVSTLSGGETFLTSLALALALSAQIQLKGQYPLEFFFLDEGFGTLDSELLDKVMTTLEELPADRMTIGVISHVPEMRHRMARRLVVEPAQPGGLGSQVKFEIL